MIIFFYGTTGESIKIAPVVANIPKEKILTISTNQQPKLLEGFYSATDFPRPDFVLSSGWKGDDLTRPLQMLAWLPITLFNFFRKGAFTRIRRIRKKEPITLVVHGDTVSTVLGALLGVISGVKVSHIEAGLRSGNWKHPFPEEIDRKIVSKLARLHYAPGEAPRIALEAESVKGELVDTLANTVADSALWAQNQKPKNLPTLPKSFCLVSVHRNEFLISQKQVKAFLGVIADYSSVMPVVFLDHPITSERITSLGYDPALAKKNITRIPKQNYINMMHLVKDAKIIITDSGGLQEESYYLGIPCIVHRAATERQEGIGSNVVLSGMDAKKLKRQLSTYESNLKILKTTQFAPTKIILDHFKLRKYI